MAELTSFNYRYGTSIVHSLDARFKMAALVIFNLAILRAESAALFFATILFVVVFVHVRLPLRSVFTELRYFYFLLFLVFMARVLSTPGPALVELKFISFTRQGLYDGAMIAWRLILIVLLALLFIATTRPSEIKAAIEWFLAPFPLVPHKRVSTMISLIMRFIPLILNQARKTADAQRARGVENRKNPVYRIVKFTIPLIRHTFETADKLAVAMESRCYTEQGTDPEFTSTKRDWIVLTGAACFCLMSLML